MKKLLVFFLLLLSTNLLSQNFQIHYDLGEDRDYLTSTFEMFKTDEYGATFLFFDMDYDNPGNRSISLAYMEVARYISLPFAEGLSATVQYNDGTAPWGPLGHVWLFGVSYPIDLGFATFNTDLLYRTAYGSDSPDAQLTLVWYETILENKIELSGFFDLWSQDEFGTEDKEFVVLTEPQIWYRITKHIALGTEIEISKNFLPSEDWEVMPTVAAKWTF